MNLDDIDWTDRFWSKIDPTSGFGPYGTCWEWKASRNKEVYGRYRFDNKITGSHRYAYELYFGPIPLDKPCVCHYCNNPPCCNPSHLYVGTKKDNAQQMAREGRQRFQKHPESIPRGDNHHNRLHPERMACGDANGSRKYPDRLSRDEKHSIRMKEVAARGERHGNVKIPDIRIAEIFLMYNRGMLQREIAREINVSRSQISRILLGKQRVCPK